MNFESQLTPEMLYQLLSQMQPAGEIIHRLPPMIIDPVTFSADQMSDEVNWGLKALGVPEVHKLTTGEGIKIAVLDTGAWDHPDMPEPLFAENYTRSPTPYDMHGHGTHCAGTIICQRPGISMAPGARAGSCKVLGDDGSGSSSGIARGIYFAISQKVDVISMSLGSPQRDPQIARAILDAIEAGILVICAAGNDGLVIDRRTREPINTVGYPARDAVAVGSFREDGQISDYSSRGPEIDIAFPGEKVRSTWIGGGFKFISGTSQAAPHGAGAAGLRKSYWLANPSIPPIRNNADLEREFRGAAQDRGTPGFDTAFGWGVIDLMKFVKGGMADATPTPKPVGPLLPGIPIGPVTVNWPGPFGDATGILLQFNK